jgi:hypothetical protein
MDKGLDDLMAGVLTMTKGKKESQVSGVEITGTSFHPAKAKLIKSIICRETKCQSPKNSACRFLVD